MTHVSPSWRTYPSSPRSQEYADCFAAVLCHARDLSVLQKVEQFTGGLPDHIRVDVGLRDSQDL